MIHTYKLGVRFPFFLLIKYQCSTKKKIGSSVSLRKGTKLGGNYVATRSGGETKRGAAWNHPTGKIRRAGRLPIS